MPELIKNIRKVFHTAKLLLRQKLKPDPASCHFLCYLANSEDFMQETVAANKISMPTHPVRRYDNIRCTAASQVVTTFLHSKTS